MGEPPARSQVASHTITTAHSASSPHSAGALALVGSGEYLPQMQSLEAALIEDAVQRGKRRAYIQIPTAAAGFWLIV